MRYLFVQCLRLGGLFRPVWQTRCFVFEHGNRVLRFDSLSDTGCADRLHRAKVHDACSPEPVVSTNDVSDNAVYETDNSELQLALNKTFGVLFFSEVKAIYVPQGPLEFPRYPSVKQPQSFPFALGLLVDRDVEYWAFATENARHSAALFVEAGRIGITRSEMPPLPTGSWAARSMRLPFGRDPRTRLLREDAVAVNVDATPISERARHTERLLLTALDTSFFGEQATPIAVDGGLDFSPGAFAALSPISIASPPDLPVLGSETPSPRRQTIVCVASPLHEGLAASEVDSNGEDYYIVLQECAVSPDLPGFPLSGQIPLEPDSFGAEALCLQ